MKCFIFVVLSIASILLVEGNDDGIDKKCAAELGMKEDGDYKQGDPIFTCYLACIYTELGVVDKEGNLDLPKFEKFMNRKYTDEEKNAIHSCESKYRDFDHCERVTKAQDCINESTM